MDSYAVSRVAIQGEAGAFSHEAARRLFGAEVELVACPTFEALFAAVEDGTAGRGMVPVENTLAGAVQRPMDLLLTADVRAVAETRVPIRLCLASTPGRSLEQVSSAASHPVALQQCHGFFEAHPWIAREVTYDTAGSIKELMEGRASYDAGIGSELAAELYAATVLVRGIEDDAANHTRFLAIARRQEAIAHTRDGVAASGDDALKTSVAFTVPHVPGALHRALGCFAERAVDLSRVESRPVRGRPWEYRFHADLRGASAEAHDEALAALRALGGEVHVIGRYVEEPLRGA
jgi:prephenate dehydratase